MNFEFNDNNNLGNQTNQVSSNQNNNPGVGVSMEINEPILNTQLNSNAKVEGELNLGAVPNSNSRLNSQRDLRKDDISQSDLFEDADDQFHESEDDELRETAHFGAQPPEIENKDNVPQLNFDNFTEAKEDPEYNSARVGIELAREKNLGFPVRDVKNSNVDKRESGEIRDLNPFGQGIEGSLDVRESQPFSEATEVKELQNEINPDIRMSTDVNIFASVDRENAGGNVDVNLSTEVMKTDEEYRKDNVGINVDAILNAYMGGNVNTNINMDGISNIQQPGLEVNLENNVNIPLPDLEVNLDTEGTMLRQGLGVNLDNNVNMQQPEKGVNLELPQPDLGVNLESNVNPPNINLENNVNVPVELKIDTNFNVPQTGLQVDLDDNVNVPQTDLNVNVDTKVEAPQTDLNVNVDNNFNIPQTNLNVDTIPKTNIDLPTTSINVCAITDFNVPQSNLDLKVDTNLPRTDLNIDQNVNIPEPNLNVNLDTNIDPKSDLNVNLETNTDSNVNVDQGANLDTNINPKPDLNENLETNTDFNVNVDQGANFDTNIDPKPDLNVNLETNTDFNVNVDQRANLDTNVNTDIGLNVPKPELNVNIDSNPKIDTNFNSGLNVNVPLPDTNINIGANLDTNINTRKDINIPQPTVDTNISPNTEFQTNLNIGTEENLTTEQPKVETANNIISLFTNLDAHGGAQLNTNSIPIYGDTEKNETGDVKVQTNILIENNVPVKASGFGASADVNVPGIGMFNKEGGTNVHEGVSLPSYQGATDIKPEVDINVPSTGLELGGNINFKDNQAGTGLKTENGIQYNQPNADIPKNHDTNVNTVVGFSVPIPELNVNIGSNPKIDTNFNSGLNVNVPQPDIYISTNAGFQTNFNIGTRGNLTTEQPKVEAPNYNINLFTNLDAQGDAQLNTNRTPTYGGTGRNEIDDINFSGDVKALTNILIENNVPVKTSGFGASTDVNVPGFGMSNKEEGTNLHVGVGLPSYQGSTDIKPEADINVPSTGLGLGGNININDNQAGTGLNTENGIHYNQPNTDIHLGVDSAAQNHINQNAKLNANIVGGLNLQGIENKTFHTRSDEKTENIRKELFRISTSLDFNETEKSYGKINLGKDTTENKVNRLKNIQSDNYDFHLGSFEINSSQLQPKKNLEEESLKKTVQNIFERNNPNSNITIINVST